LGGGKLVKYLLYFFGILLGALAIIAGEADDSPGLQGLGLILVLLMVFRSYKRLKSSRKAG
jgi:hypothetical protein